MRAPYFKVYIAKNNRDVSGFIEDFKFEDCVGEDNLVTLAINRDFALRLADDDDFVTGTIISFQFGVMGETVSALHSARMTNIDYNYTDKVTMTVQCLDLGTTVKKVTSQKIWTKKTSSQIAQEIAVKYGLDSEVEPTTKVWDSIPQGNKSDLAFLKYLANREEGGNFIVFIRDNTLYFTKRNLDKESVITYTYNYGKGPVISFKPSVKESSPEAGAGNTSVVTGFGGNAEVDGNTEDKGGTTGAYRKWYGEEGKFEGKHKAPATADKPKVQTHIVDPTQDKKEAKNIANSSKKKNTLKTLTADLTVEGNCLLSPNNILTMKNVAKRHEGNWWIEKVAHSISHSGYTCTLSLNKNGGKKVGKTATKAPDANTTVGDKKVKSNNTVKVFTGEDGKYIGKSKNDRTKG